MNPGLGRFGSCEVVRSASKDARSVLDNPNRPQAEQFVIRSDQREIHQLSRRRQKPVGGIAVRQRP
jgi:hypothetical protein